MSIFSDNEILIAKKFFPHGVVAFDVETTGLSPIIDHLVELSAVKIDKNGNVTSFDELIKPPIQISNEIIKIHGITNEMVADKPVVETILPKFLAFLGDATLVAHNAKFDSGFLVFLLQKYNIEFPDSDVLCSCELARNVFKGQASYKLSSLAKNFSIELLNHHRALDDSIAALKIMLRGVEIANDFQFKRSKVLSMKDFKKNNANPISIPKELEMIEYQIKNNGKVEIIYQGGSHKNQFRPIRPVAFIPMPDGLMLYAHCLLSDTYKYFAISKIAEVRLAMF